MAAKDTKEDLPSTLKRSPKKAQRTWLKAHNSAVEEYGDEERAHRVAFSALKHSFEKVGDHWEHKSGKGPSDARAKQSQDDQKKHGAKASAGGVDASKSKSQLYEEAQKLDVPGRSKMDKDELVSAIDKANDRATRKARS